mmetsp:Transcript_11957/g.35804  ORF Transcript_11957/g.35804 Transcript_11957/m.35804 type:complete len:221 (+) Transcript_11957:1849-2511(+)
MPRLHPGRTCHRLEQCAGLSGAEACHEGHDVGPPWKGCCCIDVHTHLVDHGDEGLLHQPLHVVLRQGLLQRVQLQRCHLPPRPAEGGQHREGVQQAATQGHGAAHVGGLVPHLLLGRRTVRPHPRHVLALVLHRDVTSFLRGHDLGVGVQDGVPDGLQVGLELLGFQAATADGHDVRHVLQQEILDALRVLALALVDHDVVKILLGLRRHAALGRPGDLT